MPTKKGGTPSPFEKRVKRRITGRPHTFFAACPPGLAGLCQKELAALPERLAPLVPNAAELTEITPVPGGVEFTARLDTACLIALFSALPVRILMRMVSFKADSFPKLEKELNKIDWELFLPRDCPPEIRVTTRKSRLYHSDAVAQRCRTAVVQKLAQGPNNTRATTPLDRPPQTLMVRADQDRFELSLDLSGTPLFKRGIKQKVVHAPLRENLAHAILTRLNFSASDILVDPMCGSGTFSLEAAMIQAALPPGFFRTFAFETWPGFKAGTFAHVKSKITQATPAPVSVPTIFASDLDTAAVDNLKATCTAHPAFTRISAQPMDFFDLVPPSTSPGVIILNPPYGLRLGKDLDINHLFKEIGRKLLKDFKGWRTGIIYPETRLLKALNLHLDPMPLFHGGLDLHAGLGEIK